jgi:hypothetical protein
LSIPARGKFGDELGLDETFRGAHKTFRVSAGAPEKRLLGLRTRFSITLV